MALNVNGKNIPLNPDGRLENLTDWNKEVAEALAAQDELHLTQAHWDVINLMREYYQQFNISPLRKLLRKNIADKLGPQKSTHTYLTQLFPRDVIIQGTKIAGLPMAITDVELDNHFTDSKNSQPSKIPTSFEFEGKTYAVHASGNLMHLEDWNEAIAAFIAKKQGIALTPEHWEIIHYLRAFYFQYGISPMVRLLKKHLTEKFGAEKASEKYLYSLFPGGPSRQGSRIAGLPEPQGCIDN